MKNKMTKIIAVMLCLTLVFALAAPVASAANAANSYEYTDEELAIEKKGQSLSAFLEFLINDFLLGTLARILPNLSFIDNDQTVKGFGNFLKGNEYFLKTDSTNYTWNVGYGQESIIPDDFGTPFKYARGSYAPWGYSTDFYTDDEGQPEDMKVRTIALDDNTGRGIAVICSVDCIGISNADVRKIRNAMADIISYFDIVSLDISAIHSHMAIDSQGVWGSPLKTIGNNLLSSVDLTDPDFGVNDDYLQTIIERTKLSVIAAYNDMKPGKLTYTDIALDGYMGTRTVSADCDGNMHKLMFYPDDGSSGTLLSSFGAHPELSSYGAEFTGDLSADFVYYMEKLVNEAGHNFIFVQGNVGTNSASRGNSNDGLDLEDNHATAIRYGYEMAYICLGASLDEAARKELNDELGDKLGVKEYGDREGYTPWYEDLPVFEEKDVEAVLNVKHKQVKIEVENSTALILLKLGLASNQLSYNEKERKYYSTTEIGYMEFGTALKAFLSPGEMYSELLVGGYGLRYSDYNSLRQDYGDNVILFDLMDDAAGYICPDETYSVMGYKYNPESGELEDDSWCLVVSMGKNTASVLMKAYADLVAECDATRA